MIESSGSSPELARGVVGIALVLVLSEERCAVDAELKRSAKNVIDRILHLRDSL